MVRAGAPSAAARPARRRLHADPPAPRVRRAAATPSSARASASQLDPERYEQARAAAFHVWRSRDARAPRRAAPALRDRDRARHGRRRGRRRADRRRRRGGVGRPGQLRALPRRRSRCSRSLRSCGLHGRAALEHRPRARAVRRRARHRASTSRSPRSAHGRRKPCSTIFAAALALGGAPRRSSRDGRRQHRRRHRAARSPAACAPCSSIATTATPDYDRRARARARRAAGAAGARRARRRALRRGGAVAPAQHARTRGRCARSPGS